MTANNLAVLIPVIIASMQRVLRQTGFVFNALTLDAQAAQAAVGQTVSLPDVGPVTPYDVTPDAAVPALTGVTPTAGALTISRMRGARFHLTGEDWKGMASRGPDFRARQIDECIAALIHEAAAFFWAGLDASCGRALGTPGSAPFGSDANVLVDAWQLLADNLAPDMGRVGVLATAEYAGASKLPQFQKANEAAGLANFGRLSLGMLANFGIGYDQAVGIHGTPAASGYLVNGAAAIGATAVTVDAGAGAFAAGDVVHFGADTTRKYVVVSATATVITLGSPLTAAVADDAAVNVAAAHRASILCHPDMAVAAMRTPAEAPEGDLASAVQVIADPVTGVALRLAHYKGYHAGQWEASLCYGFARRRTKFGVKLIA